MSEEVVLSIRFTVDGKEVAGEVRSHQEAFKQFGLAGAEAYNKALHAQEQARGSAVQYTAQLKRQADTLGLTKTQTLAYEASQHQLTAAEKESVTQSIKAIDAYDKKQAMLVKVTNVARTAGLVIGTALVAGLVGSVTEAARAEQAHLKLEAVLRATGNAAGLVKPQLDAYAESLKRATGIDDDAIRSSMAVLLTFKQVQGETFRQTMTMAADLSKLLGQDLQSSVLMLGKALEDPESGLLALRRAGVSFNDATKEMIKELVAVGKQAEALELILNVMRTQGIDRLAESMNTGYVGAMNKATNATSDFFKMIGQSAVVKEPTLAFLEGVADRLNRIRDVVENGTWIEKVALIAKYSGNLLALATMPAVGDPNRAGAAGFQESRASVELGRQEDFRDTAMAAALGVTKREGAGWSALEKFWKDQEEAAKKAAQAREQFVTSLKDEAATLGMTTEQAKLYKAQQLGITGAQLASVKASLAQVEADKQKKVSLDAYLKLAEIHEQVMQEIADLDLKKSQANAAAVVEMDKRIESLGFETSLMGLSNAERERAIALHDLEARAVNLSTGEYERYRDALEEIYGLRAVRETQQKNLEEAKRINEEIGRSLTDALLRGFEAGKGFAENFRDTLVNMFNTLVLRPVIEWAISPISGAITAGLGSLGIPGLGNAAGLTGMGDVSSWASGLGSLFGAGGSAAEAGAASGIAMEGAMDLGIAGSSLGGAGAGAALAGLGVMGLAALAVYKLGGFGETPTRPWNPTLGVSGTAGAGGVSSLSFSGDPATPFSYPTVSSPLGLPSYADEVTADDFTAAISDAFAAMTEVGTALGLDTSRLATAEVPFSFDVASAGSSGFGPESSEVIAAFSQNLGEITDELALVLMPGLAEFALAGETATETLVRLVVVQEELLAAQESLEATLQQSVLTLPDTLGITALEDYQASLATSAFVAPMDALGAAQKLYDETLAAARGGDLGAVQDFPQVAQDLLGIGRDVYASGAEFAALFTEVNTTLNDVIQLQQGIQTDILADVPVAIQEAAQDQIAELKAGFAAVVAELEGVQAELQRIQEAA